MKHAWNIVWKLVVVLVFLGVILLVVGLFTGGLRPFSIDSGGIHFGNQQSQHIDDQRLDAFANIDVQTQTMAITIVTGDHYGLKVDAINTSREITSQINGNTSTLALRQASSEPNVGWSAEKVTAVITVPANTMHSINITSDAAMVTIKTNCDTLTVQTSAGVIDVSGDVKNDLKVQSAAGAITLSGAAGTMTAETNAGMVTVTGSSPVIDVHSQVGAVNISMPGKWASTNYSLATTIGAITTSGDDAPGNSHIGTVRGGPSTGYALKLTVETTVGAITVDLS